MASGVVWVSPGMLPATMRVMPKSPRARQNASTVPAITARDASGSVIVQKTLHPERPSVRAACSSRRSTASKPAWAALMKHAPDHALTADQDEKVVAEDGRGQDERQDHQRLRGIATRESLARQNPRDGQAGGQGQDRGDHRYLEGEPERKEIHSAYNSP